MQHFLQHLNISGLRKHMQELGTASAITHQEQKVLEALRSLRGQCELTEAAGKQGICRNAKTRTSAEATWSNPLLSQMRSRKEKEPFPTLFWMARSGALRLQLTSSPNLQPFCSVITLSTYSCTNCPRDQEVCLDASPAFCLTPTSSCRIGPMGHDPYLTLLPLPLLCYLL